MKNLIIAFLCLFAFSVSGQSIWLGDLNNLRSNAVQGTNTNRTGPTATNANLPVPTGVDLVTDDTNGPNVLTGNTGWPYWRLTLRSNTGGSMWRTELVEHFKDMSLFFRRYSEETFTYSPWYKVHSNQWFPVKENIAPTNGQALIYNSTTSQWDAATISGGAGGSGGGASINDASTSSTTETYSVNKILSLHVGGNRIVSGTTDTWLASDCGKTIEYTSSSPVTVTIPSALIAATCYVNWLQDGTGQITFVAGSGTTLQTFNSQNKSAGQRAQGSGYFKTASIVNLSGATAN